MKFYFVEVSCPLEEASLLLKNSSYIPSVFDLSPFVSQDPDLGGYVQFSVSVAHPDPHKIERKDPDPHQSDKLYPDPHQFADDKPQCMEHEPI